MVLATTPGTGALGIDAVSACLRPALPRDFEQFYTLLLLTWPKSTAGPCVWYGDLGWAQLTPYSGGIAATLPDLWSWVAHRG